MRRKILLVLFLIGIVLTSISIVEAKEPAKEQIPINKDIYVNRTIPAVPFKITPEMISRAKDVTKDISDLEKKSLIKPLSSSGDGTDLWISVKGLEYTQIQDPKGYCENRIIYSSWLTGDIWDFDCWYYEQGVIHAWYLNDFFMLPITVEVWNTDTALSPAKNIKINTKITSCGNNVCNLLFNRARYTDANGIAKFPFKISKTKYQQYGNYYYVNIDVWDIDNNRYDYDKDFYLSW